uniref:Uncharacterized protein n=1 Tax=Setaria viridis TaxID=4556 RepID=A0A4U6T2I2_SETVI|nr:hypothetical protein SEVIR_9G309300v2 [Setaria viridis]
MASDDGRRRAAGMRDVVGAAISMDCDASKEQVLRRREHENKRLLEKHFFFMSRKPKKHLCCYMVITCQ